MIDLTLYDHTGQETGQVAFDESFLGPFVNRDLLHAAVVMYEANRRQGTAKTKSVREVVGASGKPFKQKGTGRARMGKRRRFGSRGGGTCFGPIPRDYSKAMPKAQRRAALRSALLGRFKDGEVIVLTDMPLEAPKTAKVAKFLDAVHAGTGALLVTDKPDATLWKSVRNLPKTDLQSVNDLCAYSVMRRPRVIFTQAALAALPGWMDREKGIETQKEPS